MEEFLFDKDAILSKISIIKNCINTIKKVTGLKSESLEDYIVQDVFVLNLQRAIQACIDIANIIISVKGLKLPATYKESFLILFNDNIISAKIKDKMYTMIGFRNIAVHDYQEINVDILKSILKNNLEDVEEFYTTIYKYI